MKGDDDLDVDRLAPVDGAPAVDFDYTAAWAVLGTFGAVATSLGEHAAGLAGAQRAVVVNWQGAHRNEFDLAAAVLRRRFLDAVALVRSARRAVLAAVDGANARQRSYNAALVAAAHDGAPTDSMQVTEAG
jgi:hypothetical protein